MFLHHLNRTAALKHFLLSSLLGLEVCCSRPALLPIVRRELATAAGYEYHRSVGPACRLYLQTSQV